MKKIYHVCISSSDEVMFRVDEDYFRAFNYFAIAAHNTNTQILCDAFMSNHIHACVISKSLREFVREFRYSFTRAFNRKYLRSGPLGERYVFITEVIGLYHILAALSYSLRNPYHHGVCSTPFGYSHSSANIFFQKELGKSMLSLCQGSRYDLMPSHFVIPSNFMVDMNGMIMRESVLEVPQVEMLYGSARNFLFYMNRLSGEKWEKEQMADKGGESKLITLDTIENSSLKWNYERMLVHERGRSNYQRMNDIMLCDEIDNVILPQMGRRSVYTLTSSEKLKIANILNSRHISDEQIKRCLCFGYKR